MNNVINNDCCFSNCFCYDCPYQYCKHEDELFNKLVNQTKLQIERGLFWISIDFEYEDETAKRAFAKYRTWLKSQGFEVNHPPTYKTWIAYCEDKTPITECGYHTGTFYFHKTNGGIENA